MKKFIATLVIGAFCLGGIGCSGDKTVKTEAKTEIKTDVKTEVKTTMSKT